MHPVFSPLFYSYRRNQMERYKAKRTDGGAEQSLFPLAEIQTVQKKRFREPSTGIYNALDEVEVELFPEIEIQELELDLQEIEVEVLEFELI